jgi:hypothetical protein
MLSRDLVEQALPPNLKSAATQALTDKINQAVSDPILAEEIQKNFISYTSVLRDGKYKTEDYLNAVIFCSYKLMDMTDHDAYAKTFPQRYNQLVAAGTPQKTISAYVSMYKKNQLVNKILEQSLIPTWVLNAHNYQKAINTQVEIMEDPSVNAMARTAAANSVLTHLAKPKEVGPLISIDMKETSGMTELRQMMEKLAQNQLAAIGSGVSPKEIGAQKVIDGKAEEVK